jgi:hypothetical protein
VTYDTPVPTSSLALTLEAREEAIAEERAALTLMRPLVVDPHLENTIDIDMLAVERMLDGKWLARLQTITPEAFGQMTPVERRTWADRAERFRKRFTAIAGWMEAHAERAPALPEFLKATA